MRWPLEPVAPTLAAALRDAGAKSARARLAAAERLGRPEPDQQAAASDALRRLLKDREPEIRVAALQSLAQLGDPRTVSDVIECLNDPDAAVQAVAVVALAEFGGTEAREPVRRALGSPHPEVRFQAVIGYAQLCGREALPELLPLLGDADPEVRANAVSALGSIASGSEMDRLRSALSDPERAVREQAALALAELGDPAAAPALREALGNPDLVFEALEGLAEIKDAAATELVAELARGRFRPLAVRAAAARTLLLLGDRRGVEALRDVITAWSAEGRSYAVQIVGELGVEELAPELAALARRPRGTDLETLEQALKQLAPKSQTAAEALKILGKRM